jgi:hypothetical protein
METFQMHWTLALRYSGKSPFDLTIKALVLEILGDRWPDSLMSTQSAMDVVRDKSPPFWQPVYPSQIATTAATLEKQDFEFRWMQQAPILKKTPGTYDWSLYISEPFAHRPSMDKVRVLDVTPPGSHNRRIAMTASSHRPLSSVKAQYEFAIQNISTAILLENQMQTLLCTVLDVIKSDTEAYVRESSARVDDIVSKLSLPHCTY